MKKLYPSLLSFIDGLKPEGIEAERKALLNEIATTFSELEDKNGEVNLNFICTHNSRRSHLSQLWAQTIASLLGHNYVNCYSGGTEATAVHPMVLEVLEKTGFQISKLTNSQNPVYGIKQGENARPNFAFSKVYDHPTNPKSSFIALMTCDSAAADCPVVFGATSRIKLLYEDPKVADGTPQQFEAYHNRSLQIATEMLYLFLNLTNQNG